MSIVAILDGNMEETTMSRNKSVDEGALVKVKKWLYITIGTVALILGFIGIFLPILPTTPLVILAAACYYKSSDKLHTWILKNKWFGEMIKNYQAGKGLTKKTKIKAISLMWIMITISAVFYVQNSLIRAMMFGIALAVSTYLLRLPTYTD
jgi:uncharacterized membrane protein YbaN (DUF454 family)